MYNFADTANGYQTRSAVLFIVFNRPDVAHRVFEAIRAAHPGRLYIAADGPRSNKPGEAELCTQTRQIVNEIDWDCKVHTLFKDVNQGCRNAVSSAITWFFEHEEEGIILEDDCLPHYSFFGFCDEMLERYRDDERIRHISGANLQHGMQRGQATYYFSQLTNVWGWAGWRRVWKDYNKELSTLNETDAAYVFRNIFDDEVVHHAWLHIFTELKANRIDTWDYQLAILNFFNHGLSVMCNYNLITNIGFNAAATHTVEANLFADIPLQGITTITHPQYIVPDMEADKYTMDYVFKQKPRKKKILGKLFNR